MIVEKGSIKYGDENDRLPADGMSADAGSGDRSERRFYFIAKTDEEISLVCPEEAVPANPVKREDGWRDFGYRACWIFP